MRTIKNIKRKSSGVKSEIGCEVSGYYSAFCINQWSLYCRNPAGKHEICFKEKIQMDC